MSFWKWSKTASANATADPSVNWAEGMPPSAVNDSGRAMMAAAAKYRDDMAGVIVTDGNSTAYTVASNQSFDSLAHLDGKVIAFTPHVTNGEAPTLSVDGLAAKPLRAAHGEPLQSNVLLEGTPYVALYSDGNGEFVLQGMTANPYGIPLAAGMDYWADTTPGSAYAFPKGQAISRTAYAKLFALVGTKFGPGDGSTTFNLPDKTGRASVMIETAASRLTPTYFGGDSTKIGAVGGSQSHILTKDELPATPATGSITNGAITSTVSGGVLGGRNNIYLGGDQRQSCVDPAAIVVTSTQAPSTFNGDNLGSGAAHTIVQPTIACNYIIRII
ncbi:phage tail protein [Afipia carboxidovorans]|uniref:phage tail protein n=1 Tax=Afipia carboxidovorans TaxID=40137 RepID=UPI0030895CF1|nr:hypothetical protein CRBSH125_35430 [Afipia carboxidovorans]